MTVLSPAQIVGTMPLLPLAPSSGPSSGVGLGGAIRETWERRAEVRVKTAAERKAALRKAAAAVEARAQTKQERLANNERQLVRTVGSNLERRWTHSTVASAMEKVAADHPDVNLDTAEVREAIAKLRHYHPRFTIGEIVERAAAWDRAFKEDPIGARELMLEDLVRLPLESFRPYEAEKRAEGMRGTVQRARQRHEDAESLKDAVKTYGANLPHLLMQLQRWDQSLREDPHNASARLAASTGAPVSVRQVQEYGAKLERQAAYQQRFDNMMHGLALAIDHGHIPGDEDTLQEMAAIMALPTFQHNRTDALDTLKRAAAIARHPQYKRLTGKQAAPVVEKPSDAGQRSIGGAPGHGQGENAFDDRRGQRSTRDAIREAAEPGSSSRHRPRRDSIRTVREALASAQGAI
ncbi:MULTISPECIES: hypothetical protein [unclassified Bradyrhizobium]|uniref:hypothetical protein n=1 Tax=unclassified Bradyrhizobium TaxID=2631580 RepID=UPI00291650A4|nr:MULTISPECIES: hypothetical protein [unclassified Bradyrhizobium]